MVTVWDLRLHGETGGSSSITGTARFTLAIFYIVTTPLQDTREVPEVGPDLVTSGDRGPSTGHDHGCVAASRLPDLRSTSQLAIAAGRFYGIPRPRAEARAARRPWMTM